MTRATGRPSPTGYRLRVGGHLDDHWSPWFGDLTLTHENDGTTSLTGVVADQAELHGLLTRIRDLGVTLLSVEVVDPSGSGGLPKRHEAALCSGLRTLATKEHQMASRLNPYVSFAGTAREAMEFYKDVFGGDLTLSTFGEAGAPDAPEADKIMHGMLETGGGFTMMGADTPPGMEHRPGNDMAVSLSGDDGDDLRGYWQKLSDGGQVSVPLEKQMWGDEFGMCTDRFGVSWMVNIGQPQA